MPLVAHNNLPSFERLAKDGVRILRHDQAEKQDIRELHIGLLNMMPDKALAATERQFFRLIGESNPIAQFHVHPFTLPELERSDEAKNHIDQYYETFEEIQKAGLDALIITGANVIGSELENQPFWEPLKKVVNWAYENVTSTLCSCLATHAVLQFWYNQKRQPQNKKTWGVFYHHLQNKQHPLVADVNTRFDVPHSRWNAITVKQFEDAGLPILVVNEDVGVHLATSKDGLRFIFFQGHPEYDTVSLLKEYKREVHNFVNGDLTKVPPFPEQYFHPREEALFEEYLNLVVAALANKSEVPAFPEKLVLSRLENTWHDTGSAIIGNWLGLVYQVTHSNRQLPFMDGVDHNDPLSIMESIKNAELGKDK